MTPTSGSPGDIEVDVLRAGRLSLEARGAVGSILLSATRSARSDSRRRVTGVLSMGVLSVRLAQDG